MKVLHISNNDFSGAGLCCLRIHQSLLSAGIESKMVVLDKRFDEEGEYQYGKRECYLKHLYYRIMRLIGVDLTDTDRAIRLSIKYNSYYTLPVSKFDLTKIAWMDWADIIHLHWVNNYLDYPSFFENVKKPIVWTLHDENLFYGIAHLRKGILPEHPLERKYRQVKLDAIKCADNLTIVFLSQMMYQKFGNERIIENRKKVIIHNPVNPDIFQIKDRSEMRRKHGVDEDKCVIVFIASNINDPNKGLDLLSEAALGVSHDIQILALGADTLKRKRANVISVGKVISQKDVCELICCANYMAMPSFQESFSQSLIEAMACGIPVIAFPVSGVDELVTDYNGIVCDDFTVESLGDAIKAILNRDYDPETIREHVLRHCSPEVISNQYIQLYKELL